MQKADASRRYVNGLDGAYYIGESSPMCQKETREQLHVNGTPGVCVIGDDMPFHFHLGRY
jgi:hypothetical protein